MVLATRRRSRAGSATDASDRDAVIATLRSAEAELRARGVAHAALFGSMARGEQRPDSDIDIMVDIDPAATRALEIISEASRRLPEELVVRHPDIAWRSMSDVGHFYRNSDHRVLEEFVWSTVTKSLPALLTVVETELAAVERESD